MNRLDLIIDNIMYAKLVKETAHRDELLDEAITAACELKDELYVKEMEQPTPKQSGNMSITVLREALAQPEQEPIECGYDETVGMCTNNPCCEQNPLPLAWATFDGEGNYDFRSYENNETYRDKYLNCSDEKYAKKYANWVIPLYALPPRKPWQGLTSEDWENTPDTGKQGCERDAELFDWIEKTLKDKNDTF